MRSSLERQPEESASGLVLVILFVAAAWAAGWFVYGVLATA
jgi:hypothetical protein